MLVRPFPGVRDSGLVRVGGANPSGPPIPATNPPLKKKAVAKPERSRRLEREVAGKGAKGGDGVSPHSGLNDQGGRIRVFHWLCSISHLGSQVANLAPE
jgi:hypothetical protein